MFYCKIMGKTRYKCIMCDQALDSSFFSVESIKLKVCNDCLSLAKKQEELEEVLRHERVIKEFEMELKRLRASEYVPCGKNVNSQFF